MVKEIYEQPGVVLFRSLPEPQLVTRRSKAMHCRLTWVWSELYTNLEQIQIVACGTSWHAGLVGKYLLEQVAGIPTQVQYARNFVCTTPDCQHTRHWRYPVWRNS